MRERASVLDSLKARGEEVLGRISGELMSNPHFMKALQAAMEGKQKLDQAASRTLKQMNIPTRTEFKRALHRIEVLEQEIVDLKAKAKARPATRRKAAPRKARKSAAASSAGPETRSSE